MSTIEFSEEQAMLLDSAREFAKNESSIDLVRARLDDDRAIPASLWRSIAELGWTGIAIPEAHGGLGLGFSHLVPIVESLGRQLMASPLIWSSIAAHAITLSNNEVLQTQWLPPLANGAIGAVALMEHGGNWNLSAPACTATHDGNNLKLSGTKVFVEDASIADFLLVSVMLDGKPRLILVEASQIDPSQIKREVVIDETRRSFRVEIDGIQIPITNLLGEVDFEEIELAAMLLLSAEMAGGHASTLELVVEYLKTIRQTHR